MVKEHTLLLMETGLKGEWKDGKPWNLTIFNKNGNIIGKLANGVLQK